jgi:serine O-acetyltransferase
MPHEVSATEPDWSREQLPTPGARLIRAIRRYQHWHAAGPWALPLRKLAALRIRRLNRLCAAEVPPTLHAGGGLMFPHPNGIVIHPDARLGVNCMIFQQVTLGTGGPKPGAPTLGAHVDVGAGAKILGGVTIGDHAKIGANAVVLSDVPPGATAVGIPAKILEKKTPSPPP